MMEVEGDDVVRDSGLIALGNRIEHYEMAAYGTARTLARLLGHEDHTRLLQQSLDEADEPIESRRPSPSGSTLKPPRDDK
jgi:ferritin-like metal-binding protein YciE